jgi:hypothetical protein
VGKTVKEVRDKKGTGHGGVPEDVLELLREDGLRIMGQLMKNMCETGEWPKDFTEVAMISLKKKPQATKCSDHRTVSLITHSAKIVVRIVRMIEWKIEDVLGEH